MRFLSGLLSFVLILLIMLFSVNNRGLAMVDFWPLGFAIEMPLYLLGVGALLLGMLLGGLMIWVPSLRHRLAARKLGKEIATLKLELVKTQDQARTTTTA
jgi:uncharacterized integral membrane protein